MSAPAANALSPAPVKITPRTRGIVSGVLEDFDQLGDRGLVEGVEHLRPVERHVRDRSLFLVQNVLAG